MARITLKGYGMDQDIRRSRQSGLTTRMTKPIDLDFPTDGGRRVNVLSGSLLLGR